MSGEPKRAGAGRTIGPAVAGSWYPARADELSRDVDALLAAVSGTPPHGGVAALIAPHAGYRYSGAVAAAGFQQVRGKRFERVIVLGPSHYAGFRGGALPDADACGTPLGAVALDAPVLAALARAPGFRVDNRAFEREHSIEAEIPFLQRALDPGFRLVPVLIGPGTSGARASEVASGLAPFVAPDTLVVTSSDFTHFGHGFGYAPFRDRIPERIRDLDSGAVRCIESWDAERLERYLAETGATVCGRDAIGVLLRLLPTPAHVELLAYDTSGRMTGDWSHSVSYAAIAVRGREAGS